jgi:hypothetical protein
MLRAEVPSVFSKEAIIEGIAIVLGAVLAGVGAKFLPPFNYSGLVYGIVGIFLVIAAVGWMEHAHHAISGFVIGLGAGLGTQTYTGIKALSTSAGGTAGST